jgi:hypothetical protein
MRLFAFRRTNAIITKVGQGPRAWTKLPGRLEPAHVARHLLADLLPTQSPRWVGVRSLATSLHLCIDVDADRTKEQILEDEYDLSNADEDQKAWLLSSIIKSPPKPSFEERCLRVERAFRRLGLDPIDPSHTLIQETPSGGRHYYFFLDTPYLLYQLDDLLIAAGLTHTKGQIEFFPSTTHGLRIPFGYVPRRPHDPSTWIQFIDDYTNGRIRRYSLQGLYDNLDRHRERWTRQTQSLRAKRTNYTPITQLVEHTILGHPKAERHAAERYLQLLSAGIQSTAEAQELIQLGILAQGTRTEALKYLAAHLIWFKHQSAELAAETLTAWAMDPRHASKDIAQDLAKGTTIVRTHIRTMCRWYAVRHRTEPTTPSMPPITATRFSLAEIAVMRRTTDELCGEDRINQCHFLLHFLAFAKHHGRPAADMEGWEATPAIRQVIRRWPGCHHMNYKTRMENASLAGLIKIVKGKWHCANGKGRARTYRLAVPVVPKREWVIDYESALKILMQSIPASDQVQENVADLVTVSRLPSEEKLPHEPGRISDIQTLTELPDRLHPPPLCPPGAGGNLEPCSRQREPQPDASAVLLGENHGAVATVLAAGPTGGSICRDGKVGLRAKEDPGSFNKSEATCFRRSRANGNERSGYHREGLNHTTVPGPTVIIQRRTPGNLDAILSFQSPLATARTTSRDDQLALAGSPCGTVGSFQAWAATTTLNHQSQPTTVERRLLHADQTKLKDTQSQARTGVLKACSHQPAQLTTQCLQARPPPFYRSRPTRRCTLVESQLRKAVLNAPHSCTHLREYGVPGNQMSHDPVQLVFVVFFVGCIASRPSL